MVPLILDLLVLGPKEVRLGAEHPGDANEGEEEEEDLDARLAWVELVFVEDLGRTVVSACVGGRRRGRTLPGERNILMSMLRRLGGGREACSQSTDHL